jgi:hypothetical protein
VNTITARTIFTQVGIIMWLDGDRVRFEAKTDEAVILSGSTANTNGFVGRVNRRLSNAMISHDGWISMSSAYMVAYGKTV